MMEAENVPVAVKEENSDVVFGHKVCQTQEAKWLCFDFLYQKFHRPNMYDIGGTYNEEVADFWITYKTEQVGQHFLLHLFICKTTIGSFSFLLSCSNELKLKADAAYLTQNVKVFKFKKSKECDPTYVTTYCFSDLDIDFLKDRKLYIAVSFNAPTNSSLATDLIADVKIKHDCGALLVDPVGSDFIIESTEGTKFPVHRAILAAHSEVFKAMLKEETAESQNNCVKLIDISEEDLKLMLEYIYTGTVTDMENVNYANLLMLADRFNLKGLWKLSEYVLSQQITVENALDILMMADMYDSTSLKISALKFIKKNNDALKNSSFKDINNPVLIKELCLYLMP